MPRNNYLRTFYKVKDKDGNIIKQGSLKSPLYLTARRIGITTPLNRDDTIELTEEGET